VVKPIQDRANTSREAKKAYLTTVIQTSDEAKKLGQVEQYWLHNLQRGSLTYVEKSIITQLILETRNLCMDERIIENVADVTRFSQVVFDWHFQGIRASSRCPVKSNTQPGPHQVNVIIIIIMWLTDAEGAHDT
jgi:hypothetical protein